VYWAVHRSNWQWPTTKIEKITIKDDKPQMPTTSDGKAPSQAMILTSGAKVTHRFGLSRAPPQGPEILAIGQIQGHQSLP
jgi:hypothetical protein